MAAAVAAGAEAGEPLKLKVATYNIHGCIGRDGKLDLPRITRVLKVAAPDVVALNEVYRYSDGATQDEELARQMGPGWQSVFGKTIRKPTADYGNAIMTRLPIVSSEVWVLDEFPKQERRGLLRVTVRKGNTLIHVFCTHMGLSGVMRQKNAAQMLQIMGKFTTGPAILMGDFNEVPPAAGLDLIAKAGFTDAWRTYGLLGGKTFPSRPALRRLDYIWLSPGLAAETCYVGVFDDARVASDHRPVFASLVNSPTAAAPPDSTFSPPLLWHENFETVQAGEKPDGWSRQSEVRGRGDGAGRAEVAVVGDEHFWTQESSGILTWRMAPPDVLEPAKPDSSHTTAPASMEVAAQIQTVTAGAGWTLALSNTALRIRHDAGKLPLAELLVDSQVVGSTILSDAGVDPYVWNTFVLRWEFSPPSTGTAGAQQHLSAWANGQPLLQGSAVIDLAERIAPALSVTTNGGGDSCKIFADDLQVRRLSQSSRDVPPPEPPPKIIRKADDQPGPWWRNFW
jgi:endonuclease/exonuclease/phosphatase family metal-dependent hydrolase